MSNREDRSDRKESKVRGESGPRVRIFWFSFFFSFFFLFSFRVSLCRDTPVVIFRVVSICARRGNTGDIYASGRKFAIQSTATCYRHCGERREKVRVTSICARNCYPLLLFFFFFLGGILRVYPTSNKGEAKVRSSSII